jgi:hypothetical protein
MNQCAFRHSIRNLLLNASMKALSVGFPGLAPLVGACWEGAPRDVGKDPATLCRLAITFLRMALPAMAEQSRAFVGVAVTFIVRLLTPPNRG